MTIGNREKEGARPQEGKLYWWLSIGRNAHPQMYLDGGWRAFVFCILRYPASHDPGQSIPYKFRIQFAYWLPFYLL